MCTSSLALPPPAAAAASCCVAADGAPPVCAQAYEWSRPTPSSLKIIHSRVYAQASAAYTTRFCLCRPVACTRRKSSSMALDCIVEGMAAPITAHLHTGAVHPDITWPDTPPPTVLHPPVLQAITLAALGAVAGIEMYAAANKQVAKKDKHGY